MCSAKEKRILFLSWSTLHLSISECIVSADSIFFILISHNLPYFHEFTKSVCIKVIYSWNFSCSTKEVVLLPLSRSTLYIAVRKYIVSLFYFFYFPFPRFTQNTYAKVIFSWKSRCSAKEAVILLLSWSTLSIAFSKCM